jgi:REP element-mobilizing transposase RayT
MDNHVHLIIDQGEIISLKSCRVLNVRYAYYFNRQYNRIGHLFQDRFKSEIIEDEKYLLAAIRYVHNNPVKAGMAAHRQNYIWSSYNAYVNPE